MAAGDATAADCNHGVTGSARLIGDCSEARCGHQGSIPARVRRFHSLIEQNTCKVCRLTEYWTSITEAGLLHYCCSSCACSDVLEIAWLLKPALSREISRHQLKNVQTRWILHWKSQDQISHILIFSVWYSCLRWLCIVDDWLHLS